MNQSQSIQRYHVTIKDLISNEEQGFMLNAGKAAQSISFSYQTLAPVVSKTQQGEVTMGDLTNTSVFVQFNRAGGQVDQFTTTALGPRGFKFWTPRYVYGNYLPTQLYWYGQGVDTISQAGEIKLTPSALAVTTFPTGEKISCYAIDEADLYIGCSTSANIYKSSDKGATWTTLVDMDDYGTFGKVRQLMIVKDKKCKKLAIVAGTLGTQATGNLFTYSLSGVYGFDVVKDYSAQFFDPNTDFEGRYPDAPEQLILNAVASVGTFHYTSILNAVTGGSISDYFVNIQAVKGKKALLITGLLADMVKAIKYVNTVQLYQEGTTAYLVKLDVLCFNDTLAPITYEFNDKEAIYVPSNGLVIDYYDFDATKNHVVATMNHIHMADTTGLLPGMVINAGSGDIKIVGVDATEVRTNQSILEAELTHMGGTFTIQSSSYQRCFQLGTYIEGKSILGTKFVTPGGVTFSVVEEYSQDTLDGATANYRTLYNQNNKQYYAPGRCTTTPLCIVADRDIGTGNKTCSLQHVQKCGSSIDTHNIVQLVKLGYDETTTQAETYIGAIVYYSTDKIPYQLIPLQLLSLKDKRLWNPDTGYGSSYQINEYQNYYSSENGDIAYLCEKKYMTQGFDEDIPTTVAGYPISVAYDDTLNTSYFSTYKKIGGDTITIRKSTIDGVEKDIDIPGVGYATGLQYGNNKVFFTSQQYGRVYQYITQQDTKTKAYSVRYELVNMNGLQTSNIQVGTVHEGSYISISDTDGVCYAYDTLDPSCPFSERFNIEAIGINHYYVNILIPLGGDIIIQSSHGEIYRWNKSNALQSRGFLVSSIYGAYLGTVKKNWIQSRLILNNQALVGNKGQKIRYAVSFDNGQTFKYLSKVRGDPFLADNFYGSVTANYEQGYADFGGVNKDEIVFRYPYDSTSKKICYKIELYKGTSLVDEFKVCHAENHYLLQSFKELYINLSIDLRPRNKLLDNSIEHDPNAHRTKLAFLQTIWQEQRKCEIQLPRGDTYFAIPFAMPNTGTDGFGVTAVDLQHGKKDLDLFTFSTQMSFKTIT